MVDLLIVNIPGTINLLPLAAPAILKSMVQSRGFTAKTLDLNLKFYRDTKDHDMMAGLESWFVNQNNDEEMKNLAVSMSKNWVSYIKQCNPKHIGLSVFTYQNRRAAEILCHEIRQQIPSAKIILGGQGIPDGGINGSGEWISHMKTKGLVDHWIRSEGEEAIVRILENDYSVDTTGLSQQIKDLDSLPWPDYSDYEFDLYDDRVLPITGSRGCVRSCSFCDIHTHWKKFVYRSGESLADEIIGQSARYQVYKFRFTDSLVNGNQKEYRKFIKRLAEHNRTASTKIKWSGQFIIRKKSNADDEMWRLTAESGASNLAIGIESGSEAVRQHIGKEFTNADIDYAMECMHNFGITCTFLMVIGYPTETKKDFEDTLDMIKRYAKYANNTLTHWEFGSTLGILPKTPLSDHLEELGIDLSPLHENFWTSSTNPELTLKERIKRRFQARFLAEELGYNLKEDPHRAMLQHMWEYFKLTQNVEQSKNLPTARRWPIMTVKSAEQFSGS